MNFPYSEEKVLAGALSVAQPKEGYRYSIDAFLLSSFVKLRPGERGVELGAGCGIVTLLLAHRYPKNLFWGVELQPRLLLCFAYNVYRNNFTERILAVKADLRLLPFKRGLFEVVYANPPYYQKGRGRLAPNEEERLARHELLATLEDFVAAAYYLLRGRWRFFLISTAERLAETMVYLEKRRLFPKRLRLIHSYPGDPGRLFLLEAVKEGGPALKVEPPFYIYQEKGGPYTPETEEILGLNVNVSEPK